MTESGCKNLRPKMRDIRRKGTYSAAGTRRRTSPSTGASIPPSTQDTNVYSMWSSPAEEDTRQWLDRGQFVGGRAAGCHRLERRPRRGRERQYPDEDGGQKRVYHHHRPVCRRSVAVLHSGCRGRLEHGRCQRRRCARRAVSGRKRVYERARHGARRRAGEHHRQSVSGNYTLTLTTDAEDPERRFHHGGAQRRRGGSDGRPLRLHLVYLRQFCGRDERGVRAGGHQLGRRRRLLCNIPPTRCSRSPTMRRTAREPGCRHGRSQKGDEFLLAYCTLKEEGGIAAQDGTMFYYHRDRRVQRRGRQLSKRRTAWAATSLSSRGEPIPLR